MKDRIAELIAEDIEGITIDYSKSLRLLPNLRSSELKEGVLLPLANRIIKELREEIEKIKNPYPEDIGVEEYRFGFWLALQKVLTALES